MATLTVYPDAHVESTSVDGCLNDYDASPGNRTWAELIATPGVTAFDEVDDYPIVNITASTTTDKWRTLYRGIFLFDTSALPDDCHITSATLSLYGEGKADTGSFAPDVNIYASAPATDTALVAGDFDSLGSIAFCDTPITYANWEDGTPGTANEFVLNAAGRAAISKTGITKLGARNASYDVAAVSPTWVSGATTSISCWFADKGATYRPKLVIEYATAAYVGVTTELCTNTIAEKSTGNGTITDLGTSAVTQHGHCWNTSTDPTTSNSKTSLGVASQTGQFQSAMTGLTPGTTYYVRAYATNTSGTTYGANVTIGASSTIGRRYIWIEGEELHFFGESGTERILEGTATTSSYQIMDWM